MKLDHAVINTQYALDQAYTCFEALGFNQTARGYHSLGSINHLMMFGTDYLELIGLPDTLTEPGQARPTRAGVSDAPVGINGLVFKTDSADATYEHLKNIGMAGDPPKSFTRPVTLEDEQETREAGFRTVHVRPDCFTAGRVYFCEHRTPELVWRSQWQHHDNGANSIAAIVLVTSDPAQQANAFASLLNVPADYINSDEFRLSGDAFDIEVMTPALYQKQYGKISSSTDRGSSIFGALKIRTDSQKFVQRAAEQLAYPHQIEHAGSAAERTLVRQPDFDTVLAFINSST